MPEVQVRQHFDGSVERVWEVLVAIERYPERVGSYESVEFRGEQREGVGARWRQTRTVFGRSHSQEMEVTRWEAPRELVLVATEAGGRYETRYELESVDGGTEVVVTFSVAATNPIAWVFVRTIGRRMLRGTGEAIEADLGELAGVVGGVG
jgi:uncharacterized protein YndB with AHSA1/START domain